MCIYTPLSDINNTFELSGKSTFTMFEQTGVVHFHLLSFVSSMSEGIDVIPKKKYMVGLNAPTSPLEVTVIACVVPGRKQQDVYTPFP